MCESVVAENYRILLLGERRDGEDIFLVEEHSPRGRGEIKSGGGERMTHSKGERSPWGVKQKPRIIIAQTVLLLRSLQFFHDGNTS